MTYIVTTPGKRLIQPINQKNQMNIKAIYDNGGKTFDRFTVYYDEMERGFYTGRGMSAKPFHPQGFGQFITGALGKHNGKRITFDSLPEDCQKLVKQDLNLFI